jgi:hypothetical protein
MNNFKKILLKMNVNLVGQLLSIFFIVASGQAVIAYLAYKKAL